MKLIRWFVLVSLLFICVLPLTSLERQAMLGIDVFFLQLNSKSELVLFGLPMVFGETTIYTSLLGGWLQLEAGLRLRTLVLANIGDLVLKSMISFPKISFGIEFSPTLFFLDSTDESFWFEGFYVAFFTRIGDRERVSRAFHLSLGATVFSYADLADDLWYFPVRVGVAWNVSTRRAKIR